MAGHLSQKTISQLANLELAGESLLNALSHVESCDQCRGKVPLDESGMITRLEPDEDLFRNSKPVETQTEGGFWAGNWKLSFGMAALLLAFLGLAGILYWQIGYAGANPDIVKSGTENKTPDPNQGVASNTPEDQTKDANDTNEIVVDTQDNNMPSEIAKNPPTPENPAKQKRSATNSVPGNRVEATRPNRNKTVRIAQPNKNRLDPSVRQSLLTFLRVTPQIVSDLSPGIVNPRSNDPKTGAPSALTPTGEVIRETTPTFLWKKTKNATQYRLYLFDENYNEISTVKVLENKHAVSKPLERGKQYLWNVVAETPSGEVSIPAEPNPPATFVTASKTTIDKIKKAEREPDGSWKSLDIALNEGMLSEGKKKLAEILKKNPNNKLAKKLLKKVRTLKGETNENRRSKHSPPNKKDD